MRKLAFWGGLVGAAVGTRWVLRQRPAARIPSPQGLPSPRAVRAYWQVTRLPHFRALYRWLARRALWGVPAGARALDIACGPGGLVLELARQAPTLELVGLDLAPAMLEVASARSRALGTRVRWQQGSAEQLPFPDQSFDLVASTLSLHHFSDPLLALNQVARVLKPGGRFMIFDLRRDAAAAVWLFFWLAQHTLVPQPLRVQDEPLGSLKASYTPRELVELAHRSQLHPWRVASGPFWLSLENANTP